MNINPNFDFRSDAAFDDREIQGSIGDDLAKFRNRVIGWSAAILTALFIVMGVWV